ncbi:MAG: hypothetical protein AAF808_20965 [Cyanobacteria bacterium P01_D01_bin.2]
MDNAIKNGKHRLSVKASLSRFLDRVADKKPQTLLMDSGVCGFSSATQPRKPLSEAFTLSRCFPFLMALSIGPW